MKNKNAAAARRCAAPVVSTLAVGFLAHMYAFTNKLLNADETTALFSKGATLTSGRWGLEATKLLFPDVSMPWIYGVISLLLIAAAVCVMVECFEIRGRAAQALLGAAVAAFPALTGNFCYMFTSAPYALAILLAVVSVRLLALGGRRRCALGVVLLAFSLGIYQAYIALAASLCIVLLIKELLSGSDAPRVLRRALIFLLLLAAALGIYYLVTLIVESAVDSGYQEYEVTSSAGIGRSLAAAYSSFVGIFLSGNFGFVNSGVSAAAHIVCALAMVYALVLCAVRGRDVRRAVLLAERNARRFGFGHCRYEAGDAARLLTALARKHGPGHWDHALLDPPRGGVAPEALEALLHLAPERLVYISCNPATLARDARMLSADYELVQVTPLDLFPHSPHVESVSCWQRRA